MVEGGLKVREEELEMKGDILNKGVREGDETEKER